MYDLDTAQPKNIFFGHLVSMFVGIIFNELVGISCNLGCQLYCGNFDGLFKVMHPPAASNPIVALIMDLSFDFIIFPVIFGTIE